MQRPTHVRRVVVTAPDPDGLAAFYEEIWGLRRAAEVDGAHYLRGVGDDHHVLVVRPGARSRAALVGLAMPDRGAVDAAARHLEARGVALVSGPAELDEPGGGYALTLHDPDGRVLELAADVAPPDPPPYDAAVAPRKISHVVLNSPRFDEYAELLTEGLGFCVADEMPHMSFFRCGTDHHSLAVSRAPHASLNHIAFEVADAAEVLAGIDHLVAQGATPLWGPGRHGPGGNAFGYFRAPNGHVIEYTAELEQIDEADPPPPRMWLPEDLELYDDWAAPESLRPSPAAREAMLGEPEDPEPVG